MSDVESTAGDGSASVMDRRALLRASGVVAGIAGLAGYAAASAPPAAAVPGAPVVMGATNDAGTTSTGLTTNAAGPTLTLANTGTGVPLRLAEHVEPVSPASGVSGDLTNVRGDLRFTHFDDYVSASVYTELTASQLIPVSPFRAVDTRTSAGRSYIHNADGNLDSSGRLIGGHTIWIYLQDEVFLGTAVFANLTVTQPVASGYLTLWPGGTRPTTSSLNYVAEQTVANFCVSGMAGDSVRVYSSRTTHVVLDVVAFAAPSRAYVERVRKVAAVSSLASPTRQPPAWFTGKDG